MSRRTGERMVAREIDLRLGAEPDSIPRARKALEDLQGKVEPQVLEDLRLMISELVTNSVRHAGLDPGEEVELRVSIRRGSVRVEVRDHGPGFEHHPPPVSMYQQSGWGLFLVEQLADRWGVVTDPPTTVWFEIDRSD